MPSLCDRFAGVIPQRGSGRRLGETLGDTRAGQADRQRDFEQLAQQADAGELADAAWVLGTWPDHVAAGSVVHALAADHVLPRLHAEQQQRWKPVADALCEAAGWSDNGLGPHPLSFARVNYAPGRLAYPDNLAYWLKHTAPVTDTDLRAWADSWGRHAFVDAYTQALFPNEMAMSGAVWLRVRVDRGLIDGGLARELVDELVPDRPEDFEAAELPARLARLRDRLVAAQADTPEDRERAQLALAAAEEACTPAERPQTACEMPAVHPQQLEMIAV